MNVGFHFAKKLLWLGIEMTKYDSNSLVKIYQLSTHLAKVLSPLIGNSLSQVQISRSFAEFIRSQVLQEDEILASFDVVSLFANMPVDLTVLVAWRRLQEDDSLGERTSLCVEKVKLLVFCLSATYLAFRRLVYQQSYGTAMSSPISVTIANLVMEEVEERALATTDILLRFWKRYVEDTCTVLPAHSLQELFDHLNGVEPSIQFTVETDLKGRLPFLDVLLQWDLDGSILTTVYKKSTQLIDI